MIEPKRIVLVTNELLGLVRTGGAGTATTYLSFALADLGHEVRLLFTDTSITGSFNPEWSRQYAARGIDIERLQAPATAVEPRSLAIPYAVQQRLEEEAPDVVVVNDWGGPAYGALRLRELGLALPTTLFVVYCHGTNGWVYDAQRRARRSIGSFELEVLERASVELADVVVSPSAYMVEWMRRRGWSIPRAVVAPYFTHATVDRRSASPLPSAAQRIRRIAFFGRLEERKGIAVFLDAVNALAPELIRGVEILFLGRETPAWPARRVREALSQSVSQAATIRFATELDQPEAIATLRFPGTLAVMPSLVDNSPNVVYECLENGIPFLAGKEGGGPELVAPDDREHRFVEATPGPLRDALARVLADHTALHPARAAVEGEQILSAWADVVATRPTMQELGEPAAPSDDFVLVTGEGDELDHDCHARLARAQAASGADVATCGVRSAGSRRDEIRLFLGEPRGLGAIANYYGLVGLYRRSLLGAAEPLPDVAGDRDWIRLARLALDGARIVSVPRPLAETSRVPGSAATEPAGAGAALAVVQAFERVHPPALRALPRLAGGLAALSGAAQSPPTPRERLAWLWQHEGASGLLRRGRLHAGRLARGVRTRLPRLQQPRRRRAPGSERVE